MKKIAIIILIIISICMFTACNYQLVDLNYKYTNALIKIGEKWMDVEIKAWRDYDGEQIQLTLEDETILLVCSVNCILYNGKLPKSSWEQRVIADACNELGLSTHSVSLELVNTEYVDWLGCKVYTYILTLSDGTRYLVGARENEDGFYCDVECEL